MREQRVFYIIRFVFFLDLFASLSTSHEARAPSAMPSTRPPSTSVGKCTYRYSRVKAMKAASTSAGTPNFRFCSQSAKAAAKAEAVCPEGKECPWGR